MKISEEAIRQQQVIAPCAADVLNKRWADTNVYNSSIKVYTVDGNQQA